MIREQHGNLITADAEALVNTVNTVGVMGKGIALQFKRAFPANFKAYKRACDSKRVQLGQMFVWDGGEFTENGPRYIVNFPTKGHWRAKSRLADIESGLSDLVRVIGDLGIKSIAVPPLGCGHGGLDWRQVRPMIETAFEALPNVDVLLFAPEGAPAASAQPVRTEAPKLTTAKAALLGMMRRYLPYAVAVTAVDIQKLMYLFQEAGYPLRLNYAKDRYGPYADNLRHLVASMEGHYIRGVGDQSAKALDVVPFEILGDSAEQAEVLLTAEPLSKECFDRVLHLIEGFESTYSLELLATVHWAATRDANGEPIKGSHELPDVETTVKSWNTRKGDLFTSRHVQIAFDRLTEQGWLGEPEPELELFPTV